MSFSLAIVKELANSPAEDGNESGLIVPVGVGRQCDDEGRDGIQQRRAEKSEPDSPAGSSIAINFCENIAEDVRDREKYHRAAGLPWADADDLLGEQVRDQKDHDESGRQGVEIPKTRHKVQGIAGSWDGCHLDIRFHRRWKSVFMIFAFVLLLHEG